MKLIKKYAGILLAILLCVTVSVAVSLPVSAALVEGPAPDVTVGDDPADTTSESTDDPIDTPSEDVTDTPSDGGDDPVESTMSDGYVDIGDPFASTESTESSDTESTDSSDGSEEASDDSSYEETPSEDEDGDEDYDYGSATYYPGNGEDITGNAGSGGDDWGADFSEGTVVSKSNNSTAKKNIADYQGKMLDLIWIPIVLIVLAAGTLVVVNVYFAKKKGKGVDAKPRRKK